MGALSWPSNAPVVAEIHQSWKNLRAVRPKCLRRNGSLSILPTKWTRLRVHTRGTDTIKQFIKAGVAGLALAGFITTAQATGGSGDGSWAGAYVGGHAGGGRGDADIAASAFIFPGIDPTSQDSFDLEGWLAGAHIGANVQHGAWVIGGELSLSAADISGSRGPECATNMISVGGQTASFSFPCQKDDEWLALGMARFGYAPGSWMGYLTAGVAVVGSQTNNGLLHSRKAASASDHSRLTRARAPM